MAGEIPALGAFFLSGAAALIFEVAWFHRAGLVFGNSLWAVTVVLSAFMGGLAIGNALVARYAARIRRPLLGYAALELTVAAAGIAAVYALPALTIVTVPAGRLLGDGSPLLNLVRLITAFTVLVVPATAMGATLPVLAGAVGRSRAFGGVLGRLYGVNTIGAVAGVMASELWLVGWVGVAGAAWFAALLNVAAAALAAGVAARAPGEVEDAAPAAPVLGHDAVAWLVAATLLSGGALMALEVAWFRFLSMYVLTTTLAMSVMLAVVLASIGLGSLLAAILTRAGGFRRGLPGVAAAAAVVTPASYAAFGVLTSGAQVGDWRRVLWFAIVLTAPTAIASGALFTLIGSRLRDALRDRTRTTAFLTAANTTGALLGPPAATFVLLPVLGMDGTFAALAIVYILVAAAAARASTGPLSRGVTAAAAAVTLAALAAFAGAHVGRAYVARAAAPYAADGSVIVETREGPSETIFLMQQTWLGQRVYSRLVTNGFSMTGTAVPGQRYMKYFAYWPMMLHDGPIRRALVVCYGLGVTAGAVLDLPGLERMDVAEISPDVIAVNRDMTSGGDSPLADPRTRLHLEDGRYFLQAATDRYDLITGEPPPPRTPGAVNIYTREYFSLVRDRLSDGGIATYWVPVARPEPGADVDTIIRAFCDVFEDCTLWNATPFDFMIAGSRDGAATKTPAAIAAPWANAGLAVRLRDIGFDRPEQIGATFLADRPVLAELMAGTPPLTDDFPRRLVPDPERPSLSDPDYGASAAAQARYQDLLDPSSARERFERSPFIRARWPEALRAATLPYFEHQRTLNRVLWEGGNPQRQIDDLDGLLTGTDLEALPLWILGSDAVKAGIAAGHDDGTGAAEYARGLSALARRDYSGAVTWFVKADSLGFSAPPLRPLAAYALCREGDLAAAARVAGDAAAPTDPDAVHFWRWMGEQCGVGPFR